MKYIIMCGGTYRGWERPRQLTEIFGEPIIERTLRLLREHDVYDIAISTDDLAFAKYNVPLLTCNNDFDVNADHSFSTGYWCSGFYPMDEPVCYLFGDVVFSPEAIRTIVEYDTDDVMFFGSKQPFSPVYPKDHEEPFAFKVVDTDHFKKALEEHKKLTDAGTHWRKPIAWELWFIVCGQDPVEDLRNSINNSYVAINDYTCDIDWQDDIAPMEEAINAWNR